MGGIGEINFCPNADYLPHPKSFVIWYYNIQYLHMILIQDQTLIPKVFSERPRILLPSTALYIVFTWSFFSFICSTYLYTIYLLIVKYLPCVSIKMWQNDLYWQSILKMKCLNVFSFFFSKRVHSPLLPRKFPKILSISVPGNSAIQFLLLWIISATDAAILRVYQFQLNFAIKFDNDMFMFFFVSFFTFLIKKKLLLNIIFSSIN